jgi:hypothetical protein
MDRWVFVHIMKTAGTSFRNMLAETPAASPYPTKAELEQNPKRWYLGPRELLARIEGGELDLSERKFLCGHYSANLATLLPGNWRTVTFLRDPVRRSLSMIMHHHREQGRLSRILRPNVMRILDDERFVSHMIRDYQTRVFAADAGASVHAPLAIDDPTFERARARLLDVEMVGLTEQFGQSLELFSSMSGLRFASLPHVNKGRSHTWTEAEIARIRTLVPRDLELYEVAREKLRSQIALAA